MGRKPKYDYTQEIPIRSLWRSKDKRTPDRKVSVAYIFNDKFLIRALENPTRPDRVGWIFWIRRDILIKRYERITS